MNRLISESVVEAISSGARELGGACPLHARWGQHRRSTALPLHRLRRLWLIASCRHFTTRATRSNFIRPITSSVAISRLASHTRRR
eukprot:743549-Prymnesium_polylepis.1